MKTLLIISSAPVSIAKHTVTIDDKFRSGMALFSDLWDGHVAVFAPTSDNTSIPFSSEVELRHLPFELRPLPKDRLLTNEDIKDADIILCSGDSFDHFHLAERCHTLRIPLVYMIELTLQNRRQIAYLDHNRSLIRRLKTWAWLTTQERNRKRAFRRSCGIQANGYPAFDAYRHTNENAMLYLDGRVGQGELASDADQVARFRHIQSGNALRLVHSGRLEPLKGSLDLIALCSELRTMDVQFELDIFGSGSLEGPLRQHFSDAGLAKHIRLHGSVDFQSQLVPHMRRKADIFVSCHRQGDPSCTYLEAMGCGIPVIGYNNAMWSEMQTRSGGGWVGPMAAPADMAKTLARLDRSREEVVAASKAALSFARTHSFEAEFKKRINHLRALTTSGY